MREKIQTLIQKIVPEKVAVEIKASEKEGLGHYSTNVAFRLAQSRKILPSEVAEEIAAKLRNSAPKGFFRKIEVVKPGFINFWLTPEAWHGELKAILQRKSDYAKTPAKKEKIQVEFVSANPTGPLTLANGRGGFLGDVLANVLEWQGHEVEREYYVNDTGNQVLTLGKSLAAALNLLPREENFYKGGYIDSWAKKNSAFVRKNIGAPMKIGQKAAAEFLKQIRQALEKKAGIKFDRYTSEENDVRRRGFLDEALKIFKDKGLTIEKEGAFWLKTTRFGDDKDRVIVKSNGDPTYILSDSGHNLETKARKINRKILILGPDHYGYVARMKAAAEIVGLDLQIIITQALRLIEKGREMKMSKRKGAFVTFEELINDVGSDVARFFFLMHAPESHMDFDLSLAKERSNKNPVYYTQYAYVRAKSIIKKCKSQKSKIKIMPIKSSILNKVGTNQNLKFISTETDIALLKELVRLPEVLNDSAADLRVHRLTQYALELARAFHDFYEKERIVGEASKGLADARLSLVWGTEIILKTLFDILGISAPKKM